MTLDYLPGPARGRMLEGKIPSLIYKLAELSL